MKPGYVLISVLFISLGLSWLPAHAGQDDSVQIRGPVGTDEVETQQREDVYGPVARTDTLWRIATQVRPDTNVTLAQVMIALLHANPHAFLDNNPNALESGFMLRIPSEEEIRAVDAETARRQIEEGAPIQTSATTQAATSNTQQADDQRTRSQQTQPEQSQPEQSQQERAQQEQSQQEQGQEQEQQTQPTAVSQPVVGDNWQQGSPVSATERQSDADEVDDLRGQLARSIENTERVLAENVALRARLQGLAQTIDDIQRTMVAEEDFQQQIRLLLGEQQPQQAVTGGRDATGFTQSILQNPWALILLTFVPALILIIIATLVLRRKPAPPPVISTDSTPEQETDATATTSGSETPIHDDFELDEAMAEFDDLDDEGDDLAALEDEMLVPVEKDDDSLSLDDDLDDLNDLDLSEFDSLDDELDDEYIAGEASNETSNGVSNETSFEASDESHVSRDTFIIASDDDALSPTSDERDDESNQLNQAELDSLLAASDSVSAEEVTTEDTAEQSTADDGAFLDDEGPTHRASSDDALLAAADSDEETKQALQALEDEEDFDFDRMVEQFADDEGEDLNDDDIEALLAKSDQLVGQADAQQVSSASDYSDTTPESFETKDDVGEDAALEEGDAGDMPSQQDEYIDIESILAEADAEPVDDEDEPQSEGSRRADAEDNLAAKLDLARAYLEMGEHDEARETIESVIEQASGELLQEANELLSRLDS